MKRAALLLGRTHRRGEGQVQAVSAPHEPQPATRQLPPANGNVSFLGGETCERDTRDRV